MTTILPTNKINTGNILGQPHNVILFNDDHHSMDAVVTQIMKATGYGPGKASEIMFEAHTKGRAIVYTGSLERCEHISSVLEEIRLGTRIEQA